MLRRRLISLFCRHHHHNPRTEASSWRHSSIGAILNRYAFFERGIQISTNATNHACEDLENNEANSLKPCSDPDNASSFINTNSNENPTIKFSAKLSLKTSSRHDLAMIFTCKVCETRSIKTVCRESYEKGVVVARCDGCNNLHLIADRLGWFGEPGSIEDYLATRGEEVKKGSIDTLNLTLEDIAGRKP
ncbi:hypothetical protein L6164_005804 [Bauhinia variegata]|uniref:Uncharacterized protein n=1 Tax=Bauhinia variegata TaxID=167791 RepID=A0ACB9PSX5_BAUVA|nr:hypothetical protein L6164_005804 [Bauhinia variegata]